MVEEVKTCAYQYFYISSSCDNFVTIDSHRLNHTIILLLTNDLCELWCQQEAKYWVKPHVLLEPLWRRATIMTTGVGSSHTTPLATNSVTVWWTNRIFRVSGRINIQFRNEFISGRTSSSNEREEEEAWWRESVRITCEVGNFSPTAVHSILPMKFMNFHVFVITLFTVLEKKQRGSVYRRISMIGGNQDSEGQGDAKSSMWHGKSSLHCILEFMNTKTW